jgi:hypothetical protein
VGLGAPAGVRLRGFFTIDTIDIDVIYVNYIDIKYINYIDINYRHKSAGSS